MDPKTLEFTLQTAVSYANLASTVFNMFLTVVFSSLAFAAAVPLREIGKPIKHLPWHISSCSFWFGISLLAFYLISFASFYHNSTMAQQAIDLIRNKLPQKQSELSVLFPEGLSPLEFIGINLGLPSIGFIIGASFGLIVFLWVANAKRPPAKK